MSLKGWASKYLVEMLPLIENPNCWRDNYVSFSASFIVPFKKRKKKKRTIIMVDQYLASGN